MRVYVPSTLPRLRALAAGEPVPAGPGHAVTAALREWYLDYDHEALEYAAFLDAARASLRLLAADPDAPRRRVVVAAEVPDRAVSPVAGEDRSAVRFADPVPARLVAAIHVDDPAAGAEVAAAVAALPAAEAGDDDAQFTVDSVEDHELAWYATQELPDVLS
jgi:hypothetical protein